MLDKFDQEEPDNKPKTPEKPAEVYTAPNLNDVYKIWSEQGKVPYSYYGQGAPTDPKELALVKQSYPGAFYQPPTPPAPAPQPQADPWAKYGPLGGLFKALFGMSGNRNNPFGGN